MESPCSVNRRQAWAQCSRHWRTVEDTELHASASSNACTTAVAQLSLQDEITPDGSANNYMFTCITVLATEKKWPKKKAKVRTIRIHLYCVRIIFQM